MYRILPPVCFLLFFQVACNNRKLASDNTQNRSVHIEHGAGHAFTLHVHNVSIGIDADAGGRVTSFMLDGQEVLSTEKIHPKHYGSSLCLRPQSV